MIEDIHKYIENSLVGDRMTWGNKIIIKCLQEMLESGAFGSNYTLFPYLWSSMYVKTNDSMIKEDLEKNLDAKLKSFGLTWEVIVEEKPANTGPDIGTEGLLIQCGIPEPLDDDLNLLTPECETILRIYNLPIYPTYTHGRSGIARWLIHFIQVNILGYPEVGTDAVYQPLFDSVYNIDLSFKERSTANMASIDKFIEKLAVISHINITVDKYYTLINVEVDEELGANVRGILDFLQKVNEEWVNEQ